MRKRPAVGRVLIRQLTERIGADALRFLCYYDIRRVTHYTKRCIEVRPYLFDKLEFSGVFRFCIAPKPPSDEGGVKNL